MAVTVAAGSIPMSAASSNDIGVSGEGSVPPHATGSSRNATYWAVRPSTSELSRTAVVVGAAVVVVVKETAVISGSRLVNQMMAAPMASARPTKVANDRNVEARRSRFCSFANSSSLLARFAFCLSLFSVPMSGNYKTQSES